MGFGRRRLSLSVSLSASLSLSLSRSLPPSLPPSLSDPEDDAFSTGARSKTVGCYVPTAGPTCARNRAQGWSKGREHSTRPAPQFTAVSATNLAMAGMQATSLEAIATSSSVTPLSTGTQHRRHSLLAYISCSVDPRSRQNEGVPGATPRPILSAFHDGAESASGPSLSCEWLPVASSRSTRKPTAVLSLVRETSHGHAPHTPHPPPAFAHGSARSLAAMFSSVRTRVPARPAESIADKAAMVPASDGVALLML